MKPLIHLTFCLQRYVFRFFFSSVFVFDANCFKIDSEEKSPPVDVFNENKTSNKRELAESERRCPLKGMVIRMYLYIYETR